MRVSMRILSPGLMNKGTLTSSGHFILVWWVDGKIRINDPASTRDARVNGDPCDFRSEVKYYWWVDAREHNKEDDDMDINKMLEEMTEKQAYALWEKAQRHAATLPAPDWAAKELTEAKVMASPTAPGPWS